MNKKRITLLSIGLLGITCGLTLSLVPSSFAVARADDATIITAGYASTNFEATKDSLKFEMYSNKAPYRNSTFGIKYQPMRDDCVTITRNGVTVNLATDHSWDMITKCSKTSYILETSMMGEYKPQDGDIYTIQGQFVSHDAEGTDSENVDGKYILDISKTSFVVSENNLRSYFAALPQHVVDGGEATMPPEPDQQWHFLFNLYTLEQADAPVTGDSYAYYPTSTKDVYIDGKPVAQVDKQALRRRDNWGYLFYVCSKSDAQNWESLISIDSLVVFNGTFVYRGVNMSTDNSWQGFTLHEVAFHKIGDKVNDYEVVNFREYLITKITNSYDINNYSGATRDKVAVLLGDIDYEFAKPETIDGVYELYDSVLAELDSYAVDPEAAAANLNKLKEKAINEIENYVNLDNYFPEEQEFINYYISSFVTSVEAASSKEEIMALISETKAKIDSVKVRKQVMIDSVNDRVEGYEQFLAPYDRVSLNDINIDSEVLHGGLLERKNDFNTNSQDANLQNTFVHSEGNDKGNLVFQFTYEAHATPIEGANLMVNLRGIPYYGYKFGIDSPSRGCYMTAISGDQSIWLGGTTGTFKDDVPFIVEIGAIDLIEYDLTWLYIKVDGEFIHAKVTDSLGICTNSRVALSPNDNNNETNDYEGYVTISNYNVGVTNVVKDYCSILRIQDNDKSNDNNIFCDSFENDIPYDVNSTIKLYPLAKESVTLTRDGVTTNIGDPTKPIMAKISPTEYQIDVSETTYRNGDVITLSGQFSYFDNHESIKSTFTLGKTQFTYDSSKDNKWTQSVTLADYKEDTKMRLEYFVNLSEYDSEDAAAISTIITNGQSRIDNCASISDVDASYEELCNQILQYKTTFRKAKDAAILEINNYKADQINEYREDEQNEIRELKEEAVANIELVEDYEEIAFIVSTLKEDIDDLKTNAQYEVEELEEARTNGIQKIQNHYAALEPGNYSEEDRQKLNEETLKAISDLKAATSIDEINSIVKLYISSHPLPKTNNNGALIAIIVASSVAAACGIGVLIFFLIRRRRKTA